jgi:hypothetical protein
VRSLRDASSTRMRHAPPGLSKPFASRRAYALCSGLLAFVSWVHRPMVNTFSLCRSSRANQSPAAAWQGPNVKIFKTEFRKTYLGVIFHCSGNYRVNVALPSRNHQAVQCAEATTVSEASVMQVRRGVCTRTPPTSDGYRFYGGNRPPRSQFSDRIFAPKIMQRHVKLMPSYSLVNTLLRFPLNRS